MAGHVPAISRDGLSPQMAETCSAMTVGRTSVITIFVADAADTHR